MNGGENCRRKVRVQTTEDPPNETVKAELAAATLGLMDDDVSSWIVVRVTRDADCGCAIVDGRGYVTEEDAPLVRDFLDDFSEEG